ncbi:hypothetical protein BBJ29_008753 [Phytophthora kernoviae]|uniref:RxLR effector protein n=1 Tax=Phytophthora kernoviae TaxID=325452 RepID=A0A3F2RD46_9STRA|nr:hypothetical protein BBJ29_008753 [Phytophthora kernoviae]RLN53291.1 hypothetical protein BBP00_00009353 [Phytophthora kernoviae]
MRPYVVLLLTLALLFAFGSTASVTTRTTAVSIADTIKRALRAVHTAEDDDVDEDAAIKEIKTAKAVEKLKAAENAKVEKAMKAAMKAKTMESEQLNSWFAAMTNPNTVYKELGLAKLGDRAMESKNYLIFEKYQQRFDDKLKGLFNPSHK